jgi:hypothetical protein
MKPTDQRAGLPVGKEPLELSEPAAGHLFAAFEQMDLLLVSQEVESGVRNLRDLLVHLRALRRELN